jgi:RNA polymerase sigma-70 factor (ECF subfamily)
VKPIEDEQLQQAYRYAMSLTNDSSMAKDIVHSAYIKVLERDTRNVKNIQGYLFRSIRNIFIDKKRFDSRWLMVPEDQQDNTVDIGPDTLEATTINQNLLKKLWEELNPIERELLYLWAVEEYTIDEISQLTDTSRGTLLSRIHRIRKKIKDKEVLDEVPYEDTY